MKQMHYAIELISLIKKLIDKLGNEQKDLGSKFRARARFLPQMILDTGLLSTLSFCFGKITLENYSKLVKYILLENDPQVLKDITSEALSYGLYLHGILDYLRKINLITDDLVQDPFKALDYLEKENRANIATNLLLPFIIEVKKLAEAIFKEEG